MDNSKSAKFMLPPKALSARPRNFQVIHDVRKKCRGNFRAESNLSIQARQMTDALKEYFREELDKIPSLNPGKRESLISDVDKYIQSLFKWLGDGKDKDHLDFNERDRLTSEHASLFDRLKALQESAVNHPVTEVELTTAQRQASQAYREAEARLGLGCADDQAYDWVKEHCKEYDLCSRDTWKRHLGAARLATNTQKHKPRKKAAGTHPTPKDDPDLLWQISNQYTRQPAKPE